MALNKLSVFKIKLQGDASWDSIISSVLQRDSEDMHCVISEQSKDYIGGYYLISIAQNQKIYNFEDSKFEIITIKKQNIVKFDIFILSGKMLLWGNKEALICLLLLLSKLQIISSLLITIRLNIFKC